MKSSWLNDSNLRKVQKIDLEMAVAFDSFCERNHLTRYLCGGGCIGAVRNGGFIPWDDDLDFFMPRKDFQRFISLWDQQEEGQKYKLCYVSAACLTHDQHAKIRHPETTMIHQLQVNDDICQGVFIDVIPIDGYAPTKVKRKIQMVWSLVYQLFSTQVVPEKHGWMIRCAGRIILGVLRPTKLRYKISKIAEKQMSKYDIDAPEIDAITELCTGTHYMKLRYPKEIFASYVYKDFEDVRLPVPVGYDTYLRTAFGDYLQMPPKDKRRSDHEIVFLDPDKSYLEYRGIHYMNAK
ncbi:MAG: LicD family protein [Blautia sp.]|nr:LicD family protein [Blautia sp.]